MVTIEQRQQIESLLIEGRLSQNEIARQVGCSRCAVQNAAKGKPTHAKVYPIQQAASVTRQPSKELWYAKYGIEWDDGDVLKLSELPENIMAMACLQVPFEHRDFLSHAIGVSYYTGACFIVLGGDLLDLLFAKPQFGMPDDLSPTQELERGRDAIAELGRAFPNAIVLTSNHLEGRVKEMRRNGRTPEAFFRQWRDVYGVPDGWKIVRTLMAGKFCFEHGHETGKGTKPSIREETVRRYKRFGVGGMTMVRAHRHTLAGPVVVPEWESQTFLRSVYYMGCGMDEKQISYSGAGVWNTVLHINDGAVIPYPMEVGPDGGWTKRIVNGLTGCPPRRKL